jgi:hypothetical protein
MVLTLLYPLLVPIKLGVFTADQWKDYSSIFDALSGVMNALVLALLIARLDSKLIGLPSWLISTLYSYAAVQPLFMVFELSQSAVLAERIAPSVLIFVFVSKIYFFLIIMYALQTGKMLNYLFCFPYLRDRAKERKGEKVLQSESAKLVKEGRATKKQSDEVGASEGPLIRIITRCEKLLEARLGEGFRRGVEGMGRRLDSWLRNNKRPLKISRWVGLAAVCYFFISLILSLLTTNVGGGWDFFGLRETAARVAAAYSHLLLPNGGGGTRGAVFNVAIDCVQLAAVLGMVVSIYLVRNKNGYGGRDALATAANIFRGTRKPIYLPEEGEKQLKKFKEYFLYFWCVTFLLYVVFLFDHLEVGLCFDDAGPVALTSKVLWPNPSCGGTPLQGSVAYMGRVLLYPFLEFLLATLNLLFIFWCFVVLRSPAFDKHAGTRQKLLVNYSSFVVLLLIALFPLLLFRIGWPALSRENMTDYATVFDGITGTLSAVVLALLIARMDSKLFGLPLWSIGLLFAYASIQPLFVAFALKATVLKMVQTSVLTAALGLKICFFLIVAYSLQSGRVLRYLICFPLLKERVDSIFENHFEIRLARAEHHKFTFSILKKNELYYSSAKTFESREECDEAVKVLRRLMAKRRPYGKPRQTLGTYWVEVRSAKEPEGLLCESIPLRSADEAKDLIIESIDKIPYCKYNRL